ncbi:MAG: hypothetical protein R3300_11830 [Candidatus Promineifilaceae bacterium]|nr:hypothetical protein [Candidatus Promineifilaceae bacterium]
MTYEIDVKMIRLSELRNLKPAAWTALLAQDASIPNIIVTDVSVEHLKGSSLSRYVLTLEGYHDPISLIGKSTNAVEALCYRDVAPAVPDLFPRCWFSHVAGDESWILTEEAYDDRPRPVWSSDDAQRALETLSNLHAAFWDQEAYLREAGFSAMLVPHYAEDQRPIDPTLNGSRRPGSLRFGDAQQVDAHPGPAYRLSEHAIRHAGPLAGDFERAAEGLQRLATLKGWPGVVDEKQLQAAADLLDDPLPILYPLRQLPGTLLHGALAMRHWQISMFDAYQLVDWQRATIGPSVWDLVDFVEQFGVVGPDPDGSFECPAWPATEETLVDSYILSMGSRLGPDFDARTHRQAIPAARCLYVLTSWFPRFAGWFDQETEDVETWHRLSSLSDDELREEGFESVIALRHYLTNVFDRFRKAYRSL